MDKMDEMKELWEDMMEDRRKMEETMKGMDTEGMEDMKMEWDKMSQSMDKMQEMMMKSQVM